RDFHVTGVQTCALPIFLAARRRGKALDTAIMVLAQTGVAVPSFWFGMLLALLFAVTLGWLPPGGFTPWHEDVGAALRSLVLPSLDRKSVVEGKSVGCCR